MINFSLTRLEESGFDRAVKDAGHMDVPSCSSIVANVLTACNKPDATCISVVSEVADMHDCFFLWSNGDGGLSLMIETENQDWLYTGLYFTETSEGIHLTFERTDA